MFLSWKLRPKRPLKHGTKMQKTENFLLSKKPKKYQKSTENMFQSV